MAEILLLGYKARSGKDTAAAMMCSEYGFISFAFADPLKEKLAELFDLSKEQLYGSLKDVPDERFPKPNGGLFTPREMMQSFGNAARALCPDVWANQTVKRIEAKIAAGAKRVVITDYRMRNEAVVVKRWARKFGHTVKEIEVVRPNNVIRISGNGDVSEHDLDGHMGWDFRLYNSGDLVTLKETVSELVAGLV